MIWRKVQKLFKLFVLIAILLTIFTSFSNFSNSANSSSGSSGQNTTFAKSRIVEAELTVDLENSIFWSNCTRIPIENEEWGRIKRKFVQILFNFIPRAHNTSCNDSLITLTTHSDFRFLDNLVPIVNRWRAPISIALYVPFDDLNPTLHRVAYILRCESPLIKKWISFHFYSEKKYWRFSENEVSELWRKWEEVPVKKLCSSPPKFGNDMKTSRHHHKIKYPVNIGRNLAREAAPTKYIFASDVELYPSPGFVPQFFKMLRTKLNFFESRTSPYVFVLPIFEIEESFDPPMTKTQLIDFLQKNISIPFHTFVCPECHIIPKYAEWVTADTKVNDLDVFHVAKRHGEYSTWEPIYVSTNEVPFYDERLSWEGLRDKMPQGYKLCVLDYDFMILNNAFLVHKPGIKKSVHEKEENDIVIQRNNRLIDRIIDKVTIHFGNRKGCKA